MSELLRFAAVTLGSVLFIVDPVAVIPTYLVITQAETAAERRSTARRACIAMSLLLIAFAATGAGQTIVVYLAIIVTGVASYLALRLGEPLLRRIGKTGIRVVTRIMGLILAALAVQFVLSGVKEAFQL
jgi:small neutral amino acid transporter SnatA (MarC family)